MRRPKALTILVFCLCLSFYACGGGSSSATSDASNDTSNGVQDTNNNTDPDVKITIPTGDATVCPEASAPTGRENYPFTGSTHTQTYDDNSKKEWKFGCTMCPGGLKWLDGKYKYYEKDNPEEPDPKTYRETMTFKGNTFENILEGEDSQTKQSIRAKAVGYFFCPSKTELADQNMSSPGYWNAVLVYTDVAPSGAFGIEPNTRDLCFIGFSSDPLSAYADILIQCNGKWLTTGGTNIEATYCKIGSTVLGKTCSNPF